MTMDFFNLLAGYGLFARLNRLALGCATTFKLALDVMTVKTEGNDSTQKQQHLYKVRRVSFAVTVV
jgi:hypothetical protein